MLEIVLGTSNEHKVYEMNLISKPFNVLFVPVEGNFNPDETGETFEENALIKANAAREISHTGTYFMADDSGLCTDYLNGAPGIKSARYADTKEHRIEKLLGALKNTNERRAHFECHLVLTDKKGNVLHKSKGICSGEISREQRGTGGFGYDPVFILDGMGKTMAELTETEKNACSHRGRALNEMLNWIKDNLA